jgi:hypothetical protein
MGGRGWRSTHNGLEFGEGEFGLYPPTEREGLAGRLIETAHRDGETAGRPARCAVSVTTLNVLSSVYQVSILVAPHGASRPLPPSDALATMDRKRANRRPSPRG